MGHGGHELQASDCAQTAASPAGRCASCRISKHVCVRQLSDDRGRSITAMQNLLPKVMFVVLPLVALVQFWVYRRQRPLYLENLVFVLHFQSFYYVASTFALLLTAGIAAVAGNGKWIGEAFEFVVYAVEHRLSLSCRASRVSREHSQDRARPVRARGGVSLFWVLGVSVAGMYAFLRA